ncbi:DUF4232 domain-containing protein [Streptomyces sp. NPDC051563]|uniref:DUF4232 domain-containing protein n=1 Tax=Streptomyces sp. NPDC051563 TaxID=3365659 RepID=UPI00378B8C9B
MQYTAGTARTAAALATALAAAALMTGCTPTGDGGGAAAPAAPPAPSASSTPTPPSRPAEATPTGGDKGGTTGGAGGGKKKPCAVDDIKVSEGHQADVRPPGTGTGAAVVSVTNTSASPCAVYGYPTVAAAGNGSPDKNKPLATTHTGPGAADPVLAPGARAWTKLTFVQVQGEADGYCASGATPASYPTAVIGVLGAGKHQIAMDDGVFAFCDDKVTVTAWSSAKPS